MLESLNLKSISTVANPYRILFFGSDHFSEICFKALIRKQHQLFSEIAVVVPFNSNVPLAKSAKELAIDCYRAPKHGTGWKDWKLPTTKNNQHFNLACVVSFGYFLPLHLLQNFNAGTLNVHPSLLPQYRGSSPIQYTILNSETTAGVSIIDLNPVSFDSGKILKQSKIHISDREEFNELHNQLAEIGSNELVSVIEKLESFQMNAWPQNESLVTNAPKIHANQGLIDWKNDSVEQIYTKYRAFGKKVPLYSTFNGKKVIIHEIVDPRIINTPKTENQIPGTVSYDKHNDLILIQAKDAKLVVKELKVADKKSLRPKDFRNGYFSSQETVYFE